MSDKGTEEICCPRFDPQLWQDKEISWVEKRFIQDNVAQIFHIPLPGAFGKTVRRMQEKIVKADAGALDENSLMLYSEISPNKGELFISTSKDVPDAQNTHLTGTFMTRTYDGKFNDIPKWLKDMDGYVKEKEKTAKKYFYYYTTCPKCAKKHGHNYVVIFAKVE